MSKLDTVKKATRISRFVPGSVTRKVGSAVLATRTTSPTWLFAAGVVGVATTVVLASRSTLKLDEVLKEDRLKLSQVKIHQSDTYSNEDRALDHLKIYIKMAAKVTKLYAPAIAVGVVSIAALTGSHKILNNRYAGMSAAYTAMEKGFEEYRDRVVSKYGEDADRELRYAAETSTIVEDTDEGPKKVRATRATPRGESIYAKIFDEYNDNYMPNYPELNINFLRMKQTQFNDTLRLRGWLFLNEVYKELGFEQTEAGQVVGWWFDKTDPDASNSVNLNVFGPTKVESDKLFDFMTMRETGIMLDFNVQGPIHKKLGKNRGN